MVAEGGKSTISAFVRINLDLDLAAMFPEREPIGRWESGSITPALLGDLQEIRCHRGIADIPENLTEGARH
jgi:hypothetical protein